MPDPEDMTLEQLEAAMAAEVAAPGTSAPAPEIEAAPAPEPTPEPTPKEEAAPAKVEAEAATVADDTPSEADILKAQLEENRAALEHFKSLSGRNEGERDFLRKKVDELERRMVSQRNGTGELDDPDPESGPAAASATPPADDPYRTYVLRDAMTKGQNEFAAEHPEMAELWPKMQTYLQERVGKFDIGSDPMEAYKRGKSLLEEALWAAQHETKSARRVELEGKRAASISNLEKAKKVASPSGSGGAAAKTEKPKTVNEMSISELDAALQQETGGRW